MARCDGTGTIWEDCIGCDALGYMEDGSECAACDGLDAIERDCLGCEDCWCPDCEGTGIDYIRWINGKREQVDCPTCHGTGRRKE